MMPGDGDERAVRLLVESVSGTVEVIAHKLASGYGMERLPELIQAGQVGAAEAARSFDKRRGTAFEGYAWPRINGAMLDMLRKEGDRLSPKTRAELEKAAAMMESAGETACDLADKTPDDPEGALGGAATSAFAARLCMGTSAPDPETRLLAEERRALVHRALRFLPKHEETVVQLHIFEGLSLQAIATQMGAELQAVRKHYRNAMRRLAAMLRPLLYGAARTRS